VILQRVNGKTLAQKVRETDPDILVLFMTEYAVFPEKNGDTLGRNAYNLQKPFSRLALLETMRDAVRAAPDRTVHETKADVPL
jgi:DNA-binding NtrC family response regulator